MRLLLIADVEQAARLPAKLHSQVLVQLRDKTADARALFEAADRVAATGARFVVNGRADVARAAGADGVHLPVNGLPPSTIRAWWPDALIGCSTHSIAEARRAVEQGADYLTAGPPFPTPNKPPIGLQGLEDICRSTDGVPVYALGGVTPSEVGDCLEVGAQGVACIRAVWSSPDPSRAIDAFLEAFVSER